jgi:uncharacterized protein YpuA (DUF1002 family)
MAEIEERKEDVNVEDVVIPSLEMLSLVDLLVKINTSDEEKKIFRIDLDKDSINVLTKLLSESPEFFGDIEKILVEIVKDNKIDLNDIPIIIVLIQKLYELIYKLKNTNLDRTKIANICASVIKFVIHILVEERKINIAEENKVSFLHAIDKLIDTSCSLLSFSKLIKVKGCFKSIFG